MKEEPKTKDRLITVTIRTVPHSQPKKAIDLIANLVLKNYSKELEHMESNLESLGQCPGEACQGGNRVSM